MMKERLYNWIKKEILVSLFVIVLLSAMSLLVIMPSYTFEKYANTLSLFFGILFILVLSIKKYKLSGEISVIYVVGLNAIAMINFLGSSDVIFNIFLLWIRVFVFIILVLLGLIIIWKARDTREKFIVYLISSLMTIILNFGGLYGSLYFMYFPYGQESFKIEQDLNYSQTVMPIDFIYYSSDAFFGTDISDVSIKYIDYMEWFNKESMESKYVVKYEDATKIIQISKMLSLFESVLFIVYISIIVMSSR